MTLVMHLCSPCRRMHYKSLHDNDDDDPSGFATVKKWPEYWLIPSKEDSLPAAPLGYASNGNLPQKCRSHVRALILNSAGWAYAPLPSQIVVFWLATDLRTSRRDAHRHPTTMRHRVLSVPPRGAGVARPRRTPRPHQNRNNGRAETVNWRAMDFRNSDVDNIYDWFVDLVTRSEADTLSIWRAFEFLSAAEMP